MLAEDLTYQPSLIEAKIQSYIAKFLASKETLLILEANPSPSVVANAKSLMVTQLSLESQLPDILAKARGITSGKYEYADLFLVYDFASKLNKQINNVNDLQKQATMMPQFVSSIAGDTIFGLPKNTVYVLGGVVAIGILGWYIWQK